MNIQDCINRVDSIKPNQYSIEDKVAWLSYLDGSIRKTIIDTHESEIERAEFTPYSADRITDELLVPFPYDELYLDYLMAKIDEANGETVRYNNTASTFNAKMEDYAKAYHRKYKPKNENYFRYL